MKIECSNCHTQLIKYLSDIPLEWRSKIVNVLCDNITKSRDISCGEVKNCETLTTLSAFERDGDTISITYKDEKNNSFERSFSFSNLIDATLDGIDPKCVATPQAWAPMSYIQRVQAIVNYGCDCCNTTTSTSTSTSSTTTQVPITTTTSSSTTSTTSHSTTSTTTQIPTSTTSTTTGQPTTSTTTTQSPTTSTTTTIVCNATINSLVENTPTSDGGVFSWTATGAASYRWKVSTNVIQGAWNNTNATTVTVTSLVPGDYTFVVQALCANGSQGSLMSLSFTVGSGTTTTTTTSSPTTSTTTTSVASTTSTTTIGNFRAYWTSQATNTVNPDPTSFNSALFGLGQNVVADLTSFTTPGYFVIYIPVSQPQATNWYVTDQNTSIIPATEGEFNENWFHSPVTVNGYKVYVNDYPGTQTQNPVQLRH